MPKVKSRLCKKASQHLRSNTSRFIKTRKTVSLVTYRFSLQNNIFCTTKCAFFLKIAQKIVHFRKHTIIPLIIGALLCIGEKLFKQFWRAFYSISAMRLVGTVFILQDIRAFCLQVLHFLGTVALVGIPHMGKPDA